MRTLKQRAFWLLIAVMISLAGARPAPAEDQFTQIGVAAIQSFDAVAKLAKDLGLPLPPQASPQAIEQQFPFIGQGGLATDKPIGLIAFGAPNIQPDQAMVFVLPVKPTAATLESFKANGGQVVVGHPDTVTLGDGPQRAALRRTADYLIFGTQVGSVTAVKDGAIADALKGPDALARVSVDLKAIRTSMPDQFKAFVEQMEKEAKKDATNKPGEEIGRQFVMDLVRDKLERVEFGFDYSAAAGLRILSSVAPVPLPAPGPFLRPTLPVGTLARVDVACPLNKVFPFVNEPFLKMLMELGEQQQGAAKLTPEQQKQVTAMLTKAGALFLGADATTVGVTVLQDTPVVYLITQYANAPDFTGGLKGLVADFKRIVSADPKDKSDLELSAYNTERGQVTRVKAIEDGKPQGYLDAVQRGPMVFMTISPKNWNAIDFLLKQEAPPPTDRMRAVAEGSVNLSATFDLAMKQGGADAVPEPMRKQIAEVLSGQKISWSASGSAGDSVTFDVTLPTDLLKGISKLVMQAAGGGN